MLSPVKGSYKFYMQHIDKEREKQEQEIQLIRSWSWRNKKKKQKAKIKNLKSSAKDFDVRMSWTDQML